MIGAAPRDHKADAEAVRVGTQRLADGDFCALEDTAIEEADDRIAAYTDANC
ncbi:MAG: hypothetical protein ACT4PP_14890 [Sporichthyaceae bacterium]